MISAWNLRYQKQCAFMLFPKETRNNSVIYYSILQKDKNFNVALCTWRLTYIPKIIVLKCIDLSCQLKVNFCRDSVEIFHNFQYTSSPAQRACGCKLNIMIPALRRENLHQVSRRCQSENLWKIKKMERQEKYRVSLFLRNGTLLLPVRCCSITQCKTCRFVQDNFTLKWFWSIWLLL